MVPHDAAVTRGFLRLGAGEAAARLIAFLATVYLARTLGPDHYGMVVLATAIMLYVSCIGDWGVDVLGVHDVARDPEHVAAWAPAYLGARLLVSAGLIVVLALAGLLLFPQPEGTILTTYSLTLIPAALSVRWVQLGLQRSGSAALARSITEAVAALLIVLLVRGPGDVTRAPLAQLAGETVGVALLFRLLPGVLRRLRPVFRAEAAVTLFRRSWPIVAHTLLGLLIFNSDFFFLRVFRDSTAVGYYAAAYTLVSFFLNLGNTYTMSLLPVLTRLHGGGDPAASRQLYQTTMARVFSGILPITIGGCLLADRIVPLVFRGDYAPAVLPLRVLIWCLPIAWLRNVAQGALLARGGQAHLLTSAAWGAGVNLLLNATVIPVWGMVGAALVTVITEGVRALIALGYCWRADMAPVPPGRLWRAMLSGGAMVLATWLGRSQPIWFLVPLSGLAYVAVLSALGGLRFRRGALPELTV